MLYWQELMVSAAVAAMAGLAGFGWGALVGGTGLGRLR